MGSQQQGEHRHLKLQTRTNILQDDRTPNLVIQYVVEKHRTWPFINGQRWVSRKRFLVHPGNINVSVRRLSVTYRFTIRNWQRRAGRVSECIWWWRWEHEQERKLRTSCSMVMVTEMVGAVGWVTWSNTILLDWDEPTESGRRLASRSTVDHRQEH